MRVAKKIVSSTPILQYGSDENLNSVKINNPVKIEKLLPLDHVTYFPVVMVELGLIKIGNLSIYSRFLIFLTESVGLHYSTESIHNNGYNNYKCGITRRYKSEEDVHQEISKILHIANTYNEHIKSFNAGIMSTKLYDLVYQMSNCTKLSNDDTQLNSKTLIYNVSIVTFLLCYNYIHSP